MKSSVLLFITGIFAICVAGRAGIFAQNVQAAPEKQAKAIKIKADSKLQQASEVGDRAGNEAGTEAEVASYDLPERTIEEDICSANPLIAEVSMQRKELNQRLEKIDERERRMLIAEKRLAEQLAALKQTQAQITDNLAVLEQAAHEDVAHLSSMYENMKPSKASLIFNKMDPNFAATFLRQMKSENAGLIMANMNADKAYSVSIVIARQNGNFRDDIPAGR